VDVLLFLVIIIRIFPVPAWIMLGVWFGLQLIGGYNANSQTGGVAYWAHAGGFVAGFLLTLPLWLRRGGTDYWTRTEGHPPHPAARYRFQRTGVPPVRRK
jgi:membrane associated rhomboid family serine protease